MLDLLERHAPGLRGDILGRAVQSPRDLERDNPNLVGGDSLGGSHHLDQNLMFRPAPGWSRHRTPVRRLYMIGASTWPRGRAVRFARPGRERFDSPATSRAEAWW